MSLLQKSPIKETILYFFLVSIPPSSSFLPPLFLPRRGRCSLKRDMILWGKRPTYISFFREGLLGAPTQRPNSTSLFIYVGLFPHRFRSLLREHLLQVSDQTQFTRVLQRRSLFICVGLFSHRFMSLLREHLLQVSDQNQFTRVLQRRLRFEFSIHMKDCFHTSRSLYP